jgi:hypothetical protein
MKYLKQNDKYSCGPVALINALKWAGEVKNGGALRKRLIAACKCKPPRGCYTDDFEQALTDLNTFDFQRKEFPELEDLDNHLDRGGAVLLRTRHDRGGHYFLCTRRTPKMYEVINWKKMRTVCKISRNTMEDCLNFTDGGPGCLFFAVAWMIKKEENGAVS